MAKEKLVKNITSRDEDFAQWYTDVVREANLCDYSSVKGCLNYLPNGFAIWELIKADLDRRCDIINSSGADMVISIHQNSYVTPKAEGAQVFYYKKSDESKKIAQIMQNVLGEKLGSTRQIKSDVNYYILLHSQLPTIISECGFLSNPEEEQRLCTEEYQERIADALYCGIIEYLMMNMN